MKVFILVITILIVLWYISSTAGPNWALGVAVGSYLIYLGVWFIRARKHTQSHVAYLRGKVIELEKKLSETEKA